MAWNLPLIESWSPPTPLSIFLKFIQHWIKCLGLCYLYSGDWILALPFNSLHGHPEFYFPDNSTQSSLVHLLSDFWVSGAPSPLFLNGEGEMRHLLNPWTDPRFYPRRDSLPGVITWECMVPENTKSSLNSLSIFICPFHMPIPNYNCFFLCCFICTSLFVHRYAIPHNGIYSFPVLFAFPMFPQYSPHNNLSKSIWQSTRISIMSNFLNSISHSFNKYLMSSQYVSYTVQALGIY